MSPIEALRKYWGHETFRPVQEEIVASVLSGRDTMAILPTGGGKSVCFQVPALVMEGLCLVVTPLVALMQDQVGQLRRRGVSAGALYAGMTAEDIRSVLRSAAEGGLSFLYVSPERLETEGFRQALRTLPVRLLAVDEAHCISQWGYDFRPSYLGIAAVRRRLPGVPVIALTASATEAVRADILEKLEMQAAAVFRQPFDRPNLGYAAIQAESRAESLRDLLAKVPGTAIVYCRTRRQTQEYTLLLQRAGASASGYHAGLPREERQRRQDAWIAGDTRVMVCTNAFGMGIDKPDVRLVVHIGPPDCLENYYQEAGRAGRDGQTSYAVLLYTAKDLSVLKAMPESRYPSMAMIRKVYESLANYLQLPSGTGEYASFPVDLEEFCRRFGLKTAEAVHALQAMQQGGVLEFQEQLHSPSTVVFKGSRDDILSVESAYPAVEPLVKALLRGYGGILDHEASVSERQLARMTGMGAEAVGRQLSFLHACGLIAYRPATEGPRVRFLQDRVKAGDLYLDAKAYFERKAVYRERVEAMVRYMTEAECRAGYIGRYFGDVGQGDCGHCDRCRARAHRRMGGKEFSRRSEELVALLRERAYTVKELQAMVSESDREEVLRILDHWADEEMVVFEADGGVRWTGKKKGPG